MNNTEDVARRVFEKMHRHIAEHMPGLSTQEKHQLHESVRTLQEGRPGCVCRFSGQQTVCTCPDERPAVLTESSGGQGMSQAGEERLLKGILELYRDVIESSRRRELRDRLEESGLPLPVRRELRDHFQAKFREGQPLDMDAIDEAIAAAQEHEREQVRGTNWDRRQLESDLTTLVDQYTQLCGVTQTATTLRQIAAQVAHGEGR